MAEENVEFVRSILAAWEKGDYSSTGWADADIVFMEPLFEGVETRGIDGLTRRWKEFLEAWDHFTTTPERFIEVGDDQVLALVHFGGRGRASGTPTANFSGGQLFTVRNGKVVRLILYSTRDEALKAAGLSE